MTGKQLLFHERARDKIVAGADILADAVKVTLGPRGRNVLIEKSYGAPAVVNSGVLVAKSTSSTEIEHPTKVTRNALINAASVAGLILATDCMIAQEPATAGAVPAES